MNDFFSYSNISNLIDSLLTKITHNNIYKGIIILIIHYGLVYAAIFSLFLRDIDNIWWLCLTFIIFNLILNYIYKGCIFMKMERKYFNDKDWYGPYNIPVYLGWLDSKNLLNFYYITQFLLISYIIFKLYNHYSLF
jgi:hypothetical protein